MSFIGDAVVRTYVLSTSVVTGYKLMINCVNFPERNERMMGYCSAEDHEFQAILEASAGMRTCPEDWLKLWYCLNLRMMVYCSAEETNFKPS
ncbi:hypothetical protein AVEN_100847-1 [Araneus ventricosus]|uniref:Uncharacterized protein n=1 Tax=Araneus ventricosus TaxID=182803 RepID=A0A4Y2AV66_ARAVE|nr:hypothetical protein AVEN_100847-1 [Araneus ventricosus]